MRRRPPRSTRTDTLFPYTALFRSQGERHVSWTEFNRRANGVAQAMLDAGVSEQDKVAQYLYNCPEYLESIFAAFKAGQAPINPQYRYLDDEIVCLWDNGDVVPVVFHGSYVERLRSAERRVGTEWARPCKFRWSQYHYIKKTTTTNT